MYPEALAFLEPGPDRLQALRIGADEEEREVAGLAVPGLDPVPVRQGNDQRLRAEYLLSHFRQPADHPALPVEVVHGEDPFGLQGPPHILESLACEQEVLQPQAGVARMQHQRVDQRVHREVVRAARVAREAAAVVEVDGYACVGIRLVGMQAAADLVDQWVDFDGVDVPDSSAQRRCNVVAAASADDHHLLERRAASVAVEQVRQQVGRTEFLDLHHLLLSDVVGGDGPELGCVGHLVVGRPERFSFDNQAMCADADKHQSCRGGGDLDRPAPPREVQYQQDDRGEPHGRRQLQVAHRREGRNAAQAAEDVHGVRHDAVGNGLERAAHHLPQAHEGHRDEREERRAYPPDRDDPAAWVGGPILRAEIDELGRRLLIAEADRDAVCPMPIEQVDGDRRREREHRHRERHLHERLRSAGRQQSDAHAQEAREQHDVGEEREEHDGACEPADRRQLEKQDQEADQEQIQIRAAQRHSVSYFCCSPYITRTSMLLRERAACGRPSAIAPITRVPSASTPAKHPVISPSRDFLVLR